MGDFLYKAKSVIIGHAVGDALGVPVEFEDREVLDKNPVTDMREYGTYNMPKGSWSDDTSMSLCALETLTNDKINFNAVMSNFVRWYRNGEFTPTGVVFDIGGTCVYAINNYFLERKSWRDCGRSDDYSNGNGSLMRIHPFVLYTYALNADVKTQIELIELASSLTHAHERSKKACGIYAFILWELLSEPTKNSVAAGLEKAKIFYADSPEITYYQRLFGFADSGKTETIGRESIKSDGYVVSTFEAAVWCLLTTDSYKECVLKAVNLGDDTDTVAAIAGGLAGALYGYDSIPEEWRQSLLKREYIEELCEKAFGKDKNNRG